MGRVLFVCLFCVMPSAGDRHRIPRTANGILGDIAVQFIDIDHLEGDVEDFGDDKAPSLGSRTLKGVLS